MTCITTACKNPDKAAAFVDFMVSKEGNDLLRLGIEGIHYTKDGDTITFNEEERAKDAFADDGWAHALAWGSFYWPLESVFIQYFSDMLQGKISIEDGVVSLGKEWRNQGGDEILKEANEIYKSEK